MNITINNVKNIREANIELKHNKINFIYGENGVGKSSLLTALYYEQEDLHNYKSLYNWGEPLVSKDRNCNYELFSDETFNIQYIKTENNNVYDLVFKDEFIIELEKDLEKDLINLKKIINLEEVNILNKNLKDFLKYFKITSKSNINNTPKVKAIKDYKPFNKTDLNENFYDTYTYISNKFEWLRWIKEGEDFEHNNNCPYCSQHINEQLNKKIKYIRAFIEPKTLEHVDEVANLIEDINKDVDINYNFFVRMLRGLSNIDAKTNQAILISQIELIKEISSFIDKSKELVENKHYNTFESLNVNILKHFKDRNLRERIREIAEGYNSSIRKINGTKRRIRNIINKRIIKYNDIINIFLKTSGINYDIKFAKLENEPIKMMFSFTGNEASEQIKPELIDNYLSFGEEKIITAMLFILYKSSDKRTMFLFDDPVTLFDKNKRFSFFNLLQTLKRESWLNSRRSRKIIKQSDYIVVLSHSFEALKESLTIKGTASYIAKNYGGYFEIDKITKNNLNNYYKNISLMIQSTNSLLVKLVLFRNLIQTNYITDTSNIMYNTISSLTKWELPATKDRSRIYSNDELKEVINNIENTKLLELENKRIIESLEFKNIIDSYNEELNWYEKIILFRIIMDIINIKDVDKVIRRFITTLFHVENDYLFNMDHTTNQTIPKYVIDILDGKIKELKENIDYNDYTMPKELKIKLE